MNRTGRVHDGTLVVTRHYPAPIDDVWASITESSRLGRWFGTWTGDLSTGSVLVDMTAEGAGEPARYDIDACEPPRLLTVTARNGGETWTITVELTADDAGTSLELRQANISLDSLAEVGPGWEWYLDRLLGALNDTKIPTVDDFTTDYLPMGPEYRRTAT